MYHASSQMTKKTFQSSLMPPGSGQNEPGQHFRATPIWPYAVWTSSTTSSRANGLLQWVLPSSEQQTYSLKGVPSSVPLICQPLMACWSILSRLAFGPRPHLALLTEFFNITASSPPSNSFSRGRELLLSVSSVSRCALMIWLCKQMALSRHKLTE